MILDMGAASISFIRWLLAKTDRRNLPCCRARLAAAFYTNTFWSLLCTNQYIKENW